MIPPKIDILPEHLIDQIKAGEVIERPGNLIKEILENAVDAGSTKIELYLQNNGLDLISLKDNGHGMRFNDLPLAFSRHATSKIKNFEDLYRLHSFGFRGEALASLAAVSKLQCISKVSDSKLGCELRIDGGQILFHEERSIPGLDHGTELVIQDLFHNTPARLKFIQSGNSEKQFLKKMIFAFILSHPVIEFHIKIDDGDKEIYPVEENLKKRLLGMLPKAKGQIFFKERYYENNELSLYLIPGHIKTQVKWQNVYINGRLVLDKQLHRVLSNALLSILGQDDFHYLVFFELPPDSIDVNVHPNKTIIKCLDSSKMISLLTSTVKELATTSMNKGPADIKSPDHPEFKFEVKPEQTLLQERHEYNMDGVFSPHGSQNHRSSLQWVGNFFIVEISGITLAFNARKLLKSYVDEKIKSLSATIPLLVSEPYPSKKIHPERLVELAASGMELEYLSADTLVLRGIPEWMNGFPLRETMPMILGQEESSSVVLMPRDWSEATWTEMVDFFSHTVLIEKKIALDLSTLLQEKLK
jgi:DNA mismatch repair protein MutL